MAIQFNPIGIVHTDAERVPRHWSVSDLEGTLEIDPRYKKGLRDIHPGNRIVVLFHFHRGSSFTPENLIQQPPVHHEDRGVFSTCSPIRPNPIGLSVVKVLSNRGASLRVRGIDMLDGTPILDIKPYVEKRAENRPGSS